MNCLNSKPAPAKSKGMAAILASVRYVGRVNTYTWPSLSCKRNNRNTHYCTAQRSTDCNDLPGHVMMKWTLHHWQSMPSGMGAAASGVYGSALQKVWA